MIALWLEVKDEIQKEMEASQHLLFF